MGFYVSICHNTWRGRGGGGKGAVESHKYIPGFCMRHFNKSNHTDSGFPTTNPRCAGTVTPSLLSPPLLFQRSFWQDPGPPATVCPSRSAFSWKSWSSSAQPASRDFVSFNSRAWRGFCGCSLQGARSSASRRRGLAGRQGSDLDRFPRREVRPQPGGDHRLQVADLPAPPAPPPTGSSSGVAVRDSCVTCLLSGQKVCLG